MVWFKVDDTLAFHHKTVAAGNAAMGMWVRAGSWSSATLTEGFIPDHMVASLGNAAQAKRLVQVGLWEKAEGGYRFHEWASEGRQPSREKVEAERASARERQRRAREAAKSRRNTSDLSQGGHGVTDGVSHGDVTPAVTVPPTRPDPTRISVLTSVRGSLEQRAHDETPPDADDPGPTEQTLAQFTTWCDQHDKPRPTANEHDVLGRHIARMLAEGIELRHIRKGLTLWRARGGVGPAAFPGFVDEARTPGNPKGRRQADTDDQFDRMLARAAATGQKAINQ